MSFRILSPSRAAAAWADAVDPYTWTVAVPHGLLCEHVQMVLRDELAAGRDVVAIHQRYEHSVGHPVSCARGFWILRFTTRRKRDANLEEIGPRSDTPRGA